MDVVFKAETLTYLSAKFFDGLSLTGAEIFAFEICLENRTNLEEKFSFNLFHISDDVDFSIVLSIVCMNQVL